MNKTLFLVFDKKLYFYNYCSDNNVDCEQVFVNNKYLFIICHILKRIGLYVPHFLYGNWKNKLSDYSKIVFSDWSYFPDLFFYIKKNTSAKLFFYYMNELHSISQKYLKLNKLKEVFDINCIYTYSNLDALENKINFLPLPYKKINIKEDNLIYDFLYIGRNKNRESILNDFYEKLNDRYSFKIMIYGTKNLKFRIKRFVSYYDYVTKYLSKSKTLIDFSNSNQAPMNLRMLESLFYNKKVITNNINIKNYPIYETNKNNILIIDFNNFNIDDIRNFMNKDIAPVGESEYLSYSFENWINSFK